MALLPRKQNSSALSRPKPGSKGLPAISFPNKVQFHVSDKDTGEIRDVQVSDLKGIFFVKSFEGDPTYKGQQDSERTGLGKRGQSPIQGTAKL